MTPSIGSEQHTPSIVIMHQSSMALSIIQHGHRHGFKYLASGGVPSITSSIKHRVEY
jgi:hypothetical protein